MTSVYLIEATVAAAQTRSNQQALALGCDGVLTRYWWQVQPLTDGTAAIVITPGGQFDVVTTNQIVTTPAGLVANEQVAIKTVEQLGTLLPNPDGGPIIVPSGTVEPGGLDSASVVIT